MRLIEAANYEEMCAKAANIIIFQVKEKTDSVLGLATGSTMMGVYKQLVEDHRQNGTSYRNVRTVNLDEYIGLAPDHPNSYRYYMNQYLFSHIDIPLSQTYIPNGASSDVEAECQRYEQLIESLGGIDLQILGIGRNGHIGFNEPGTPFSVPTHVVELAPSTRQANARFFPSLEEVPRQAITMGIATIMKSRHILLLASGTAKAAIMAKLFEETVTTDVPASVLHTHPNVTVIADREALSLVPDETRKVYGT
ncbi:glucosamine-6-phosphate deaminase [Parageobacillus thermoglucosidasius]|uniref:glucosamine-6-phosphate deaminase n=1 Tax=Parageobacillus thermoglucosidasius TaxID=1426 RepID=UPI000E14A2D4|nr:glucosamine-6-phosphate deaminase [Parageobacillus thermoglucosidasius]RDE31661.1 glucosamine-6-phosphate deaminase [Parageobacillus thermoglucosidasius]